MKLQFNILGVEVWTLELVQDGPAPTVVDPVNVASKGAKWVSKHWVKWMIR